MHETAELGIAAHWLYKAGRKDGKAEAERLAWLKQLMDWQQEESDPGEFMRTFRTDLYADEVFVFTPKGEVKGLPVGSTPIDFAYAVHTDVGHRTVGAKVNGRIVPLHYKLKSGDFVEVLTSKQLGKGPSRDWLSIAKSSRARNKIRQWWSRETREDTEQRGRESLEQALKQHNLPYKKVAGSQVLAGVIREMNFKKAEDFYLGARVRQAPGVAGRDEGPAQAEDAEVAEEERIPLKPKARSALASQTYGINVPGVEDVLVRMAKCCNPVPGDHICGYISLGKGITIHREDCPNVRSLRRNPERFTEVEWDGGATQELPSPDRGRLLGPPAAARGRGADVRRARREHRRVLRPRGRPDGEELVRRRDR